MTAVPVEPAPFPAWEVVSGPERFGSELLFSVRLADGTRAVLGQLLPELAHDEVLRRRYVGEVERVIALNAPSVAKILAHGPAHEARDPGAPPPWRLREDPEGESLERWLSRTAPAPVDETVQIARALLLAIAEVHDRGALLRDVDPRRAVLTASGRVVLTDVGLARLGILSTRTAQSLILEGSPYCSPEQLRKTTLDQRSDLFGAGVFMWRALAGDLPFGQGAELLAARTEPPSLRALNPAVPRDLERVIRRCLADSPEDRPDTAREVERILAGEPPMHEIGRPRVRCQSCGASLHLGQRLCTSCGKEAVQLVPARRGEPRCALDLLTGTEDAEVLEGLRGILDGVRDQKLPVPDLEFIIGDRRMYSASEQRRRIQLPVQLFDDLTQVSAERLSEQISALGLKTRIRGPGQAPNLTAAGTALAGVVIAGAAATLVLAPFLLPVLLFAGFIAFGAIAVSRSRREGYRPASRLDLRLRPAPLAIPASDALVRRLAALLPSAVASDLKEQISRLALLVQRWVDRKAELLDPASRREAEILTEPLEPLVALVENEAKAILSIDQQLAELDEGLLVRALATSQARREEPSRRRGIMEALDKLRELEESRTARFHRLLEAGSLLSRSVQLGLQLKV
jgi:hypothetical protein